MKPPRKIKVGYRDYKVEVRPAAEMDDLNALGLCRKQQGEIWLSENMNRQQMTETFLHEVLHAVWYAMSIAPKVREETAVTALSNGLAGVIRDNPAVAKYLAAGLRGKKT